MFETEKKTEQNRERDDQMSEPKPLFIYHNVHLKGKKKIQLLSLSVTQVFSLRSVNVLQVPSSPSPNVPSCHKDKIARKRPLSHGIMAVICIVHPESHRKGDRTANAAAAHACQGSLPALLNSHFAHLSWATGGPAQNSVLDYSVSIDQC